VLLLFLPPADGVIPASRPSDFKPNSSALARKLFDALLDNFCEIASLEERAGMWNGVLGGGSSESSLVIRRSDGGGDGIRVKLSDAGNR